VSYNGGSTNVLINQQSNGGGWRLIAAGVDFAKGTNGFVRLGNNAGPNVVLADAVRFDYVEAQDFPTNGTIPTWWRDFFFGGPTDPSLDVDGDGYTAAQEYVMGTIPTNSNSHLEIGNQKGGSNTATVTFWPLLGNRNYTLVYRPTIGIPIWQNANTGPITATPDGHGIVSVATTNAPQSYFRLKVQMSAEAKSLNGQVPPTQNPALSTSDFVDEATCGPYRIYVRQRN